MKNYQGRELHYRPSAEELEDRKQSTMSKKYGIYIFEQYFYFGGYRTKYMFPNGYGASVINNNVSNGLELSVLYFDGKNVVDVIEHDIAPNVSVDVFGRDIVPHISSEKELDKLLEKIKESQWED